MLECDLKGDLHGEGSIFFNESRGDVQGSQSVSHDEVASSSQGVTLWMT